MKKYELLLFDADNTLLDFSLAERNAFFGAMREFDFLPTEEIYRAYSSINDGLWKQLEKGEVDRATLCVLRFERLFAACGLSGDAADFNRAYFDHLGRQRDLLPGALDVVKALSKDYRLYLVTNGTASVQYSRLPPSPIYPFFRGMFVSEEVGHAKPAKAYFDAVAARIEGFDPARALVIGDSLTSDIRGGQNAGIDTCWLNRSGAENPFADLRITYTISHLEELYDIL